MAFDNEALISAVFKRTVLWDVSNKYFKDRKVSAAGWDEVCKELQTNDLALVKKKWKVLKDYYRTELMKFEKQKSGSPGTHKKISSWPYFEQMGFVRKTFGITKRPCSLETDTELMVEPQEASNTTTDTDNVVPQHLQLSDETENSQLSDKSTSIDDQSAQRKTQHITSTQHCQEKRRKLRKRTAGDTFRDLYLQHENKKLEILQKSMEDDDDMHFFQSLLPDVRSLPRSEKLMLRIEMQRLVYNAVTRNEMRMSASHIPSSSANSQPPSSSASSPLSADYNVNYQDTYTTPMSTSRSELSVATEICVQKEQDNLLVDFTSFLP